MKFRKFINDKEVQNDLVSFFVCLGDDIVEFNIHVEDDALIISSTIEDSYEYIIKYDEATSPGSFSCIYRYPEIDDYLELTGTIIEKCESVPIEKLSYRTITNVFDKMWNENFLDKI